MSERNITIICIALLSVIALGGGGLLYYLEFVWIAELNEAIATLKEDVRTMEDKQSKLPALLEKNKKLRADIKVEETRIPRLATAGWQDEKGLWHFEYDELVNLIDGLRKASNVFVVSEKYVPMSKTAAPQPGVAPLPANVHKVTYDLSVKGPWFNLLRFVNLLESQKRSLAIEKFAFKPASGEDKKRVGPPRHDLQIRVVSYTYRDQPGAPGAPAAGGTTPVSTDQKPAEQSKSTLPPD